MLLFVSYCSYMFRPQLLAVFKELTNIWTIAPYSSATTCRPYRKDERAKPASVSKAAHLFKSSQGLSKLFKMSGKSLPRIFSSLFSIITTVFINFAFPPPPQAPSGCMQSALESECNLPVLERVINAI